VGSLVDGKWQRGDVAKTSSSGHFERGDSAFRSWITPDGSPGPAGRGGFAAEPDRYHLYVSLACPWASRTLIMRAWKKLDAQISLSVTHWHMGEDGWSFEPGEGVTGDPLHHFSHLHQLYTLANPSYTGKVTVPVLWDKKQDTIVSNESADILRMFNSAFGASAAQDDYCPKALRAEIDAVNERIYGTLNNAVYRAGFAKSQQAYEEAALGVFDTLDWLEQRLASSRFVVGDAPTEADVRLFTTLVRFDAVYHGHFKCNVRRLVDYPNVFAYARHMYQLPGVAETVSFEHIKRHYYTSHPALNPSRIVPIGPKIDWNEPARR
jgi:putative glutathione S-transferase